MTSRQTDWGVTLLERFLSHCDFIWCRTFVIECSLYHNLSSEFKRVSVVGIANQGAE